MSPDATRIKVSVLLMSTPAKLTAQLCIQLGPDEVRRITEEMMQMPPIDPGVRDKMIREFLWRCQWCTGRSWPDLVAAVEALGFQLAARLLYECGPKACKRWEN